MTINSTFNAVVDRLANVGVKGKTTTMHFHPLKSKNGKTYVTRECIHCGCKMAVVFRGIEDTSIYTLWCPRCHLHTWSTTKPTPKPEQEKKTCKGTTKKNKPCKNPPMPESEYCASHQYQDPNIPDHKGKF